MRYGISVCLNRFYVFVSCSVGTYFLISRVFAFVVFLRSIEKLSTIDAPVWGFPLLDAGINQWRAAIGSFKALTSKSERFCVQNPSAMLLLLFQLYLFAFCFTLISTTILPPITIFSLLRLLSYSEPYFLQIFSKIYWSVKVLACCLPKLLKRAYIIILTSCDPNTAKVTIFLYYTYSHCSLPSYRRVILSMGGSKLIITGDLNCRSPQYCELGSFILNHNP